MLELLKCLLIFLLFCVHVRDDYEYGGVAHVVTAQDLDVHLETFLEEAKSILIVTGLHIALAEKCQDL